MTSDSKPRAAVIGLLALALASPGLARASEGKRVALVVGNSAYETGRLRNPAKDATAIAAALREAKFDVDLVLDADRRDLLAAVDRLVAALQGAQAGLFYFAGHGVQIEGGNFLVPVGARVNRADELVFESVPVDRVLGAMESVKDRTNIVILDACRDNPFPAAARSLSRGLAVRDARGETFIAYATAPGKAAADGDGDNGVFTKHLLRHLPTPGLEIEQLFKRVTHGVHEETRGDQDPWRSSNLKRTFVFHPATGDSPQPPVRASGFASGRTAHRPAALQGGPLGLPTELDVATTQEIPVRRQGRFTLLTVSGGLDAQRAALGGAGTVMLGTSVGSAMQVHAGVGFPGPVAVLDAEITVLGTSARWTPVVGASASADSVSGDGHASVEGYVGLRVWVSSQVVLGVRGGLGRAWNMRPPVTVSADIVPVWLGVAVGF